MKQTMDELTAVTAVADHKRLKQLRALDPLHDWASPDDRLHCVLCESTFTGRNVRIIRRRTGERRLACATSGCLSTPAEWVRPGNPLVSEDAWLDWSRLLTTLHDSSAPRFLRRRSPETARQKSGW